MTSEQAQRIVELVKQRGTATSIDINYTADTCVRVIIEHGKHVQSTHLIEPSGKERG